MNCPNCGSPGVHTATEWRYECGSAGNVMKPAVQTDACKIRQLKTETARLEAVKRKIRDRERF